MAFAVGRRASTNECPAPSADTGHGGFRVIPAFEKTAPWVTELIVPRVSAGCSCRERPEHAGDPVKGFHVGREPGHTRKPPAGMTCFGGKGVIASASKRQPLMSSACSAR